MREPPVRTDQLHVVTCISNPVRYQSRWRLYERFAERMARTGVRLLTVELAYGERPFVVTRAGCRDHVQLRSRSELWSKENLQLPIDNPLSTASLETSLTLSPRQARRIASKVLSVRIER